MIITDKERRRLLRLEKLGTNKPICGTCGEKDWRCLESDHVADYGRDEATVQICRNCHRKKSDDQKDHPQFNPNADPQLDRIGHFLIGLADLLALIIEKLFEFGYALIDLSKPQIEEGESA